MFRRTTSRERGDRAAWGAGSVAPIEVRAAEVNPDLSAARGSLVPATMSDARSRSAFWRPSRVASTVETAPARVMDAVSWSTLGLSVGAAAWFLRASQREREVAIGVTANLLTQGMVVAMLATAANGDYSSLLGQGLKAAAYFFGGAAMLKCMHQLALPETSDATRGLDLKTLPSIGSILASEDPLAAPLAKAFAANGEYLHRDPRLLRYLRYDQEFTSAAALAGFLSEELSHVRVVTGTYAGADTLVQGAYAAGDLLLFAGRPVRHATLCHELRHALHEQAFFRQLQQPCHRDRLREVVVALRTFWPDAIDATDQGHIEVIERLLASDDPEGRGAPIPVARAGAALYMALLARGQRETLELIGTAFDREAGGLATRALHLSMRMGGRLVRPIAIVADAFHGNAATAALRAYSNRGLLERLLRKGDLFGDALRSPVSVATWGQSLRAILRRFSADEESSLRIGE